jgi:hypothetical protein
LYRFTRDGKQNIIFANSNQLFGGSQFQFHVETGNIDSGCAATSTHRKSKKAIEGSQENVAMPFLPGLVCSLIVIAGLLVFGAIVLRVAISLSNKCLGASPGGNYYPEDEELDEWIGYRQIKRPTPKVEIPTVGIGKGMISTFLLAAFGFLPGIPMRYHFDTGYYRHDFVVPSYILGLAFGFPISALVLAGLLPTKFGRACLVLLMAYLIIFGLIGGLWAVVYILVGRF